MEAKFRFLRDDVLLVARVDEYTGVQHLCMQKIDPHSGEIEFESAIQCIHTAVTSITPAELFQIRSNTDVKRRYDENFLQIRSSERLQTVELAPGERFFAMKSWVQGIAEAGFGAFRLQTDIEAYGRLAYPIMKFLLAFMARVSPEFLHRYLDWTERSCTVNNALHGPSFLANMKMIVSIINEGRLKDPEAAVMRLIDIARTPDVIREVIGQIKWICLYEPETVIFSVLDMTGYDDAVQRTLIERVPARAALDMLDGMSKEDIVRVLKGADVSNACGTVAFLKHLLEYETMDPPREKLFEYMRTASVFIPSASGECATLFQYMSRLNISEHSQIEFLKAICRTIAHAKAVTVANITPLENPDEFYRRVRYKPPIWNHDDHAIIMGVLRSGPSEALLLSLIRQMPYLTVLFDRPLIIDTLVRIMRVSPTEGILDEILMTLPKIRPFRLESNSKLIDPDCVFGIVLEAMQHSPSECMKAGLNRFADEWLLKKGSGFKAIGDLLNIKD